MRVLKIFGLILLALVALVLIMGLIAPNRIVTQQSTVINASQAATFQAVNDLKQWPEWSPWNQRDNTMKIEYSEKTEGAGAYYSWTSENSGAGQMTITDTYGTDSLTTLVEFDGQGNTIAKFLFEPQSNAETKVTWSFDATFPYPFNAMMLFQDVKSFIDKDYAEGLGYLKAYVEGKSTATPAFEISMIDYPGAYYLVQRDVVSMSDMNDHFQTVMPAVGKAFIDNDIAMAGAPSGLYYTWDEESQTSDMALGVPAAAGTTLAGLTTITLPAGKALQVNHYGDYAGTAGAHGALDAYMKEKGLTFKAPAMERYVTDPTTEPDTSKWLTEVIYFIEE